jgi:BirA family transcriptional regulator, biotin operon repressor / biotin---[acetyl-CoA-carboxylase] ligase
MEPLDIERICREISALATPYSFSYFEQVDSTNRVAAMLPVSSFKPGTVIVTDHQSAGRGRSGRAWMAPPRTGLLMSVVLEAPPVPGDALLAVALAVVDALRSLGAQPEIKWPNDILIRGRKVCGILAESVARDQRPYVIVGCGINVLAHPDLPGAGSVAEELGRPVDRTELAIEVFKCLDLWYRSLSERADGVFAAWLERLQTIGQEVVVSEMGGIWTGTATGVERDGGLQVRRADGSVRTVLAADVSIRSAEDFTTT